MRILLAILILPITLASSPAHAAGNAEEPDDNCHSPIPIVFAPGSDHASVSDVVMRDGARCYVVTAKKGQRLSAKMTPNSSPNAALLVFRPGWGFRPVHGYVMMDGAALPGGGREDAGQGVRATLPISGRYLLEAVTARGDAASYTLDVRIR